MPSLQKIKIKDICTKISSGGTPSRKKPHYFNNEGEYGWIKSKELNDSVIYDSEEHITETAYKNSSAKEYPENTILFAMYGATVGKMGILGKKSTTNQAIAGLEINNKKANYKYIFYNLLHNRSSIIMKAFGAAQQNLNLSLIGNYQVNMHELREQQKIATILWKYDRVIENNKKRIKILEEMAQAIYTEWFVNFKFPGHENVKFVNSELGKIPEGWRVDKIGNILASVKTAGKLKKGDYEGDGSYPVIDQGADYIGGYSNKEDFLNNNILPIVIFGDHTRILKYIDFPYIRGADGTKVLYSENMPTTYLYLALVNIDLGNFHYERHFKFLKEKYILIPEKRILIWWEEIVNSIFKKISLLRNINNNLSLSRDLLIPKLISGEIDVSELNIEVEKDNA